MCLTSVKKNTAYAKSQTEQVYTNTLPMDTLEELTVNSLQKLEWLWQFRDIALPLMSVKVSSPIMQARNTNTGSKEKTPALSELSEINYKTRLAIS